jgi:hypothetical protein
VSAPGSPSRRRQKARRRALRAEERAEATEAVARLLGPDKLIRIEALNFASSVLQEIANQLNTALGALPGVTASVLNGVVTVTAIDPADIPLPLRPLGKRSAPRAPSPVGPELAGEGPGAAGEGSEGSGGGPESRPGLLGAGSEA